MRIAMFTDNFYPEISGITDSLVSISTELGKRGHQVIIFAPRYSKNNFKKSNFKMSEIKIGENVNIVRFSSLPFSGSPTGQSRIVLPLFFRCFSIKKNYPDIIHTHSPFGVGLEALFAAKILRLPFIGTNHTPISEFMSYSSFNFNIATKIVEKYFIFYYNKTKFVTAPSSGILNDMVQSGLKQPHKAISNPVDIDDFLPVGVKEKNNLKEKMKLGPRVILYTGRLAPEKNIDIIIKAVALTRKKIGDIKLVITGYGSAEQDLKNLTNKLKLDREVIFTGMVDKKTLSKYYSAADIFTVMSTAETQCLSLMNAFATGLPSVVANARALPEFVNHKRGLLVKPNDFQGLANAFVQLLTNPKQRIDMGQNAHNFVESIATSQITDKWEKIYKSILNNKVSI